MSTLTLGSVVTLPVIRRNKLGFILDGANLGELLLPAREVNADQQPQSLVVFVYPDQEARPQATTQMPRLLPSVIGRLRVVSTGPTGAFLDWGLPKDLLLPFSEQSNTPEVGRWQTVRVCLDDQYRPYASTRIDRYLDDTCDAYHQGESVPLVVIQRTDLGYKVAVENRYWGLLADDTPRELRSGQRLTGYVQRLREDQRLSLSQNPPGAAKSQGVDELIMERLEAANGQLPFCDKSSAAAIRSAFGCSKNAFKQALGKLYKQRRLVIERDHIHLP